jgi:RimJ/RimL family protein N-acetyltransferase
VGVAWTQLGAHELISLIQPGNEASRRVAERLGMQIARADRLGTDDVLVYRKLRP